MRLKRFVRISSCLKANPVRAPVTKQRAKARVHVPMCSPYSTGGWAGMLLVW